MKPIFICCFVILSLASYSQTTGTINEAPCIHFSYDDNGNREVAALLVCLEIKQQEDLESLAEVLQSDTSSFNRDSIVKTDPIRDDSISINSDIKVDYTSLVSVYPNPVSTLLNIRCDLDLFYSYVILSAEGKFVTKGEVSGGSKLIDVSSWSSGDYFIQVRFQSTNQISTYKVVVL